MGAIFVLQTIIIEIGGKVFNTTLLEPKALLVSMVLAVLIIPVDLIRKAIMSQVNNTYEIIIMGLSQVITVRQPHFLEEENEWHFMCGYGQYHHIFV